ncbi:DNA-binding Xre family transcriptional regulator [Virgibacillus halotolerans]|uniref:helix-turn-helix domain-containing protein n=1 Tax=Virgibacillus halotolerans TaxID=1071053 RepID=UPI001961625A|nr:DNA-binding Xre family transcriptional regulator [Virgibacillus halotolerans]
MISYEPLFITLIKKKMKLNDLREKGIISSATQSKFRKGESVTLTTVQKVCIFLDVPIQDVVEIISEE